MRLRITVASRFSQRHLRDANALNGRQFRQLCDRREEWTEQVGHLKLRSFTRAPRTRLFVQDPQPPSEIVPLPPEMETVILRCLRSLSPNQGSFLAILNHFWPGGL